MPEAVFRHPSEHTSGHAVLYVLLVIPLVISLGVLAVDVSNFQAQRDRAQKEADRISLAAAQALPDVQRAEQILFGAAARLTGLNIALSNNLPHINISSSKVSIGLEGSVSAFLDFFVRKPGGEAHVFHLYEQSTAQLVPGDYAIVLADAASLRPAARRAWGSSGDWPASAYFAAARPPALPAGSFNEAAGKEWFWPEWWKEWDNAEYRRWATQACYNPLFSGLKYAAISLLDMLGALDTNRISLIFTPGDASGIGFRIAQPLDFVVDPVGPVDRWDGYFERETYISDEACVYFADRAAAAGDGAYELQQAPFFAARAAGGLHSDCYDRVRPEMRQRDEHFPYGALETCFVGSLSLREAVYYRAARNAAHSAGGGNVTAAIDQAYLQLFSPSPAQQQAARTRRGNLHAQPLRKVFVLSDVLPDPGAAGFADLLARFHQARVELIFVAFLPEQEMGQDPSFDGRRRVLEERVKAFDQDAKVFVVQDSAVLAERIMPAVAAAGRELAIRS